MSEKDQIFNRAAEQMSQVTETMEGAIPSLRDFEKRMKQMTDQVPVITALPLEEQLPKFKSHFEEFAKEFERLDEKQREVFPLIREQLFAALNNIEAAMESEELTSEDIDAMEGVESNLESMQKDYERIKQNLYYMRQLLGNIPDLNSSEIKRIEATVGASFEQGAKILNEIGRAIWRTRTALIQRIKEING